MNRSNDVESEQIINTYNTNVSPYETPETMSKKSGSASGKKKHYLRVFGEHHDSGNSFFCFMVYQPLLVI